MDVRLKDEEVEEYMEILANVKQFDVDKLPGRFS